MFENELIQSNFHSIDYFSSTSGKRKKVKLNLHGGYLQQREKFPWLSNWWQRQKQILRWKILAMASSGYLRDRWRSVEILSKLSLDSGRPNDIYSRMFNLLM